MGMYSTSFSSIINTIECSDLEQNSIAKEDWHMFCQALKEKYTIHKKKLSKKIIENWYLIAKVYEKKNHYLKLYSFLYVHL